MFSNKPDPSYDAHLEAAHARHERELDEAASEALTTCDVCEERKAADGECLGCGAQRCPECGVMSHFILPRGGVVQCDECALVKEGDL